VGLLLNKFWNRAWRAAMAVETPLLNVEATLKKNGVRAFWWSEVPNFGDRITPLLLRRYGFTPVPSLIDACKLVSTGSILDTLADDFSGTILGSGFILPGAPRHFEKARILALRGSCSWKRVGSPAGGGGIPDCYLQMIGIEAGVRRRLRLGLFRIILIRSPAWFICCGGVSRNW